MSQLKEGDVVQLKSGGPKMTILGGAGGQWVCQWFTNSGLQDGTFAAASLRAVEGDELDAVFVAGQ
jgi:uncharacterized protein YodC (DUF2158 family)